MIPGFTSRITTGGIGVRRWHYSSDSTKRPGTPIGDKWLAEESRAYPLGMDDPRWQKEMEIKPGAMGGQHLFPRWETWKHNGYIVIGPYNPVGTRLYGSYDHGYRNPAAFHVHSVDGDGVITTVWEFYGSGVPAHQIAPIIKGHDGYDKDGVRFKGNPYGLDALSYIVADPSIWKEDIPDDKGPQKSTAKIFRDLGVTMIPGEKGGDVTVANWLHGWYWKDPEMPRYRITANCVKLIWEIGQQRFKEFSAQVALNRNQPDELIDKDNHAFDGLKYLLKKFPPPPAYLKPELKGNTFAWWRKQAIKAERGERTETYRISAY